MSSEFVSRLLDAEHPLHTHAGRVAFLLPSGDFPRQAVTVGNSPVKALSHQNI